MKFLLLFLLPFSLFASQILSYNIYDRTDRADLMITFDTPYTGIIKKSRGKSKIIIKLENASIESQKIKKVASKFLKSIVITPLKNQTEIIATVPQSVRLIASKTADGYGLRLRFANKTAVKSQALTHSSTTTQTDYTLSNLPTKKGGSLTKSYIIVIAILIIGILILLYIKKKTTPAQMKKNRAAAQQKTPWLFNPNRKEQQAQTAAKADNSTENTNEVVIRFQKPIDANNCVVMLDFGTASYLVLMGKSNILLDKFHENSPSSQQEFESILQSRHEELENFLNGTEKRELREEEKEPLQAYKERAASIIYNNEL